MAVIVTDYLWKQTGDHVVVTVPLKGVPPRSVDILTDHSYIKANFKPFIFEAFLFHPIEDSTSKCTISDGEIEFHLEKQQKNLHWDSLCATLSKDEKQKARMKALSNVQNRSQEQKIAKQEMLQGLQRKSVQQQIELETSEKKKVEKIKNDERKKAMTELEVWKSDQTHQDHSTSNSNQEKNESHSWNSASSRSFKEAKEQKENGIQLTEDDLRPVPIPRVCRSICVKFTPRAFPTPQRESQIEEEQTWLKKQAEAQRSVGFVAQDLRPEECNPVWLKEKGDSFFKVGNYLGAISAYSHGIKLSSSMSALYVNRSAAHYALGNLQRVIEDCSSALELMTPKVSLNEDSRAKCHARRGAALCKLGMLKPGLADLEAALVIRPEDEKLQLDIEDIRSQLKSAERS